ncbi:MAG: CAP domain-containing protein [Solirubrobacteraceae bacterium]
MARRLLLLALAAGTVALPATPAAAAEICPGENATISALTLDSARDSILCLVNAERTSRGLNALVQDDGLQLSAQRHTEDMLARGFFDHVNPDGDDPGDRITAAGYDWWAYGENIAAGYRTPRDVMLGWMKSTGHCHNILDPGFTELGVGVTALAATLSHALGTWTQNFGRPAGTHAPGSDRGPQEGCAYTTLAEDNGVTVVPADDAPGAAEDPAAAQNDGTTAALTLALRRAGKQLIIDGAAIADRLQVTISWRGRTIFRTAARVRDGHYRIRLRNVPRHGRITVRVRGGLLRVTRSVS